jgi:hypothetical protein
MILNGSLPKDEAGHVCLRGEGKLHQQDLGKEVDSISKGPEVRNADNWSEQVIDGKNDSPKDIPRTEIDQLGVRESISFIM